MATWAHFTDVTQVSLVLLVVMACVLNSIRVITCVGWCLHHRRRDPNSSRSPGAFGLPFLTFPTFFRPRLFTPHCPATTDLFLFLKFCHFKMLFKLNHTICGLQGLAFYLFQHNSLVHVRGTLVHSFLILLIFIILSSSEDIFSLLLESKGREGGKHRCERGTPMGCLLEHIPTRDGACSLSVCGPTPHCATEPSQGQRPLCTAQWCPVACVCRSPFVQADFSFWQLSIKLLFQSFIFIFFIYVQNILSVINDGFILLFIILGPFVSFSWLTALTGTFSTLLNGVEAVSFLVLFITIF